MIHGGLRLPKIWLCPSMPGTSLTSPRQGETPCRQSHRASQLSSHGDPAAPQTPTRALILDEPPGSPRLPLPRGAGTPTPPRGAGPRMGTVLGFAVADPGL